MAIKDSLKRTVVYDFVQRYRRRQQSHENRLRRLEQIKTWELNGRQVPPPDAVKQQTVLDYAQKFSLRVLVETGTCLGDMIDACTSSFDELYTIELDQALFKAAQQRFSYVRHVSLHQGDSGEVLGKLLKQLDRPCLFWLDAHYSGGVTAKGTNDTPILNELAAIFQYPVRGHVILIDDARCFTGQEGYPTLGRLTEVVADEAPHLRLETSHDIIRITPRG